MVSWKSHAGQRVANHLGSSLDFTVHPFQDIVGSDPGPVVSWKSHAGQRLVDSFPQDLSRRPQVHVQQLGYHFLGLLLADIFALLGLDGLKYRGDFSDFYLEFIGQNLLA